MKKGFILIIVILLAGGLLPAQTTVVPQGFKYQAVARDAGGKPYASTDLLLSATLKEGGLLGTIYYEEEHAVTTSELGLINLTIGGGTPVSGSFTTVPWSGGLINLVLRISLDGGLTWLPMGESPLLSVPYALYAGSSPQATGSSISDASGNTRVDTEEPASPGQVRITLAGQPAASFVAADGYNRMELTGDKHNTVIGQDAMPANVGIQNTAVGWNALNNSQEASNNTAIGSQAMLFSANGVDNTAVGINALVLSVQGDRNVAIGGNALYSNNASDNVAVGKDALYNNTSGERNVAIGNISMFGNTEGSENTAIGYLTMYAAGAGYRNTVLGANALVYNTTGSYNTALGALSMTSNTQGQGNTAVGSNTLYGNNSGSGNTALGGNALYQSISGEYNTAVGFDAMRKNYQGGHNVAIGCAALYSSFEITGQVAVGDSALYANYSGYTNSAMGYGALRHNNNGFGNTAVGFMALHESVQSSFNTALGRESGMTGEYVNTTSIGAGAKATKSNQVVIGNTTTTQIGGYTNWSNLSDSRFKLDVQDNVPGLAFINQLRPVTYRLDIPGLAHALGEERLARTSSGARDDKAAALLAQLQTEKGNLRYTGFIAQDVEAAAANLDYDFSGVDKPQTEEGMYALRYAEFVVPLVKAVQEQQVQIEALQAENLRLKEAMTEIEQLRAAVDELRRTVTPK